MCVLQNDYANIQNLVKSPQYSEFEIYILVELVFSIIYFWHPHIRYILSIDISFKVLIH